jgi:hypothetical protein
MKNFFSQVMTTLIMFSVLNLHMAEVMAQDGSFPSINKSFRSDKSFKNGQGSIKRSLREDHSTSEDEVELMAIDTQNVAVTIPEDKTPNQSQNQLLPSQRRPNSKSNSPVEKATSPTSHTSPRSPVYLVQDLAESMEPKVNVGEVKHNQEELEQHPYPVNVEQGEREALINIAVDTDTDDLIYQNPDFQEVLRQYLARPARRMKIIAMLTLLDLAAATGMVATSRTIYSQPTFNDPAFYGEVAVFTALNAIFSNLMTAYPKACFKGKTCGFVSKVLTYSLVSFMAFLWVQALLLGGFDYFEGKTFGIDYGRAAYDFSQSWPKPNANGVTPDYSFLVASDAQFQWFGNPYTNVQQANTIQKAVDSKGKRPSFIIFNGDLTEHFHPYQAQQFFNHLYSQSKLKLTNMIGLGNHDLIRNQCYGPVWSIFTKKGNWCAQYAKELMTDYIKNNLAIKSWDPASLSYSWDVGSFHFIQLQNYLGEEFPQINLASGVPWLVKDLKEHKDKHVILNMHIPDYTNELASLLNYNDFPQVCATFAGHYHFEGGRYGHYSTRSGDVPVFLGGSADSFTMLMVEVNEALAEMSISTVSTNVVPQQGALKFKEKISCKRP